LKKLLKYLKPYTKYAVLAPSLLMIEVFLELQQPRLMGNIVDLGIARGDMSFVITTAIKMIIISFAMSAGGVSSIFFSSRVSQSFGADVRNSLFEKIQSFSFSDIDKFKTSSLITRLTNDVTQVQLMVLMGLRMMFRAPLLAFGGFFMAARLNLKLSLVLAIALPILAAAVTFFIYKSFPLFRKVQKKLDRINLIMRENLSGIRVVKAFVRFDYEQKRFDSANSDYTQIGIKAGSLLALSMPAMIIIMNFTVVAVLWYGGFLAQSGEIEVGKIIAFINYSTQILFSFMMLGFLFINISRAYVSAGRINEVLETESTMQSPQNAITKEISNGVIEFKNVSFKYNKADKNSQLKNINLKIAAGETVAILGETGSGKTTLVNLIPRLYDVSSGQVLIDGVDVKDYDIETLRSFVGMVPQDTVLFTGTIADNIKWGNPNAQDDEIKNASSISQASEFLDAIPDGYDTIVGQRGVGLSGGQRQRVAIARAIAKNPKILIFDDSTSAVDVVTEAKIQQNLKEQLSTRTFIIVAQRISSALDSDRIIVLKDGEIAEQGTHSELIAKNGIYTDIYKSQLGTEGI